MNRNRTRKVLLWLLVNICRMLLAFTFIFSGTTKIIDPKGMGYKLQDYGAAFGLSEYMPYYTPLILAFILAVAEFCLGIYLFFGLRRRLVSWITFLVMLVLTPFTLYLAFENPVHDCGCFGDAIVLTNWQTFGKNVVLLLCSVVVWLWGRMQTRFISERNQWTISLYSWVYASVLALYCIYTLPIVDFRAFRIGADIEEQMQWGDDGEIPPIPDLQLIDVGHDVDITDSVISSPGWKFLIVAPYLEEADDGVMDKLAELTDYCDLHGYRIYCLTASDDKAIEYWSDITGSEYPYCRADATVLKTMVRSNPGIVLLNGSMVVQKWAATQLPDEQEYDVPLEEMVQAHPTREGLMHRISMLTGLFLIPLFLFSLIDRIWMAWRWSKRMRVLKLLNININSKKQMRKHIVAGNWKMNKTLQEGVALATELKEVLAAEKPNCEVIIGTPFIHLATVSELLKDSVIAVSAENCANKESGAYTGEVSAAMVKSTGAEYVILGHSERREYYAETPEILKEKVDLALANGLKVIFCIGESLEQREANEQEAVCKAELAGSVFHLTAEQWKNIVIAYEPIWAIGTGKTATAEQAEEIHAYIRGCVAEVYGAEVADETSILYGGSCKASNAPELFGKADIDGGLIGGASLKAGDFKGIIDAWN